MAGKSEKRIIGGDVQDLAVAVEQLVEETRLLRMSLDELRDDVIWATRQILAAGYQFSGTPPPAPRDPLAPDMPAASARSALRDDCPAPVRGATTPVPDRSSSGPPTADPGRQSQLF